MQWFSEVNKLFMWHSLTGYKSLQNLKLKTTNREKNLRVTKMSEQEVWRKKLWTRFVTKTSYVGYHLFLSSLMMTNILFLTFFSIDRYKTSITSSALSIKLSNIISKINEEILCDVMHKTNRNSISPSRWKPLNLSLSNDIN